MTYSSTEIWTIIVALGIGTFLIRFSFMGIIGSRQMPEWVLRHLRYTPMALLPGMVAPLVVWPDATGGVLDAPRLAAAVTAIVVGRLTKNVMLAVLAGAGVLNLGFYLVA